MPRSSTKRKSATAVEQAPTPALCLVPERTKPPHGVPLKTVSWFTMAVAILCLIAFLMGRIEAPAAAAADSMGEARMFHGLRTASYDAKDLAAAKAWYSKVLGIQPYFDQPFYVGFDVGGYELGLVPETSASPKRTAAGVAYWGVDDAEAAYKRMIELGATPHVPIADVGGGILIGSVHDPFGNVLGIIQNPNFKAR